MPEKRESLMNPKSEIPACVPVQMAEIEALRQAGEIINLKVFFKSSIRLSTALFSKPIVVSAVLM